MLRYLLLSLQQIRKYGINRNTVYGALCLVLMMQAWIRLLLLTEFMGWQTHKQDISLSLGKLSKRLVHIWSRPLAPCWCLIFPSTSISPLQTSRSRMRRSWRSAPCLWWAKGVLHSRNSACSAVTACVQLLGFIVCLARQGPYSHDALKLEEKIIK